MVSEILDFIWPRHCEYCGNECDRQNRYICSSCLMKMPMLPITGCCKLCGYPIADFEHEYICEECRKNPPHFDRVASCFRFENRAREIVHNFKFRRHTMLVDDFVDFMEASVKARMESEAIDLILPFPISKGHRFWRGYNQCDDLADKLAERLDRRCLKHALKRVNSPKRQSSLAEKERHDNVVNTIEVCKPSLVRGRTILVVDDILTTGSSLSECARVLKAAGAWRVWAITIARSVRKQ